MKSTAVVFNPQEWEQADETDISWLIYQGGAKAGENDQGDMDLIDSLVVTFVKKERKLDEKWTKRSNTTIFYPTCSSIWDSNQNEASDGWVRLG